MFVPTLSYNSQRSRMSRRRPPRPPSRSRRGPSRRPESHATPWSSTGQRPCSGPAPPSTSARGTTRNKGPPCASSPHTHTTYTSLHEERASPAVAVVFYRDACMCKAARAASFCTSGWWRGQPPCSDIIFNCSSTGGRMRGDIVCFLQQK